MKNKIKLLIGTVVILAMSTLYHNIYKQFPNFITSLMFPINESIFEHNKMILLAFFTWSCIEKLFYKDSNTPFFNNLVACILCITLVLAIFTPVYFLILKGQDSLIITIAIYTFSIAVGLFLSSLIKLEPSKKLEAISIFGFLILLITFAILTYYHPNNIIFKELSPSFLHLKGSFCLLF